MMTGKAALVVEVVHSQAWVDSKDKAAEGRRKVELEPDDDDQLESGVLESPLVAWRDQICYV